jgi:hypothetical protein
MSVLNVDNELLQQSKAVAVAQGKTVEEFVEEALRLAVQTVVPHRALRNGLPTMIVNGITPAIDPQKVRRSIEEDGI